MFGGEGFVLQRLSGEGSAFAERGGEVVRCDLQPGQKLLAHPGHVGLFEESVSFEIATISGVTNLLFGGDGLFLVPLRGPGEIRLQPLTPSKLARALAPNLPARPSHRGRREGRHHIARGRRASASSGR